MGAFAKGLAAGAGWANGEGWPKGVLPGAERIDGLPKDEAGPNKDGAC